MLIKGSKKLKEKFIKKVKEFKEKFSKNKEDKNLKESKKRILKSNKEVDLLNLGPQESVGALIQHIRQEKNISQEVLGNAIGVSSKSISKWENNNGFPDQLSQLPLAKELGITLEELHSGQIDVAKRKKDIRKKKLFKILFSSVIGLSFLILVLIGLLIYFIFFHDSLVFKYIDIEYSKQTFFDIDGYYIKDKKMNMLYIGNIGLLLDGISETDNIEINILYDKKIIYTSSSLKNISVDLQKDVNPEDLSLNIIVIDEKNEEEKYNETLKFHFSNIYSARNNIEYEIDNNGLIKDLEKEGFVKINNDTYRKTTKEQEVVYDSKNKTFMINTIGDDKLTIDFKIKANIVNVSLTSKIGNDFVMTEKYKYYLETKELTNYVGYGFSLENALKILEPYITLRNRYLKSTN